MGTSSSSTADPVIAVAQAVARTPSLDEIANVNTANVQPEVPVKPAASNENLTKENANVNTANVQPEVPVKPAASNENLTKENTQGKETFSVQQNIVQQQPKTTRGDITTITNYLEALSVSRDPIPVKATKPIPEACVTNLNALLSEIYVRYIKLDEEAFERYYKVFDAIFLPLNKKMKEVDPYYNKYQSMVKFAGSHYDNLLLQKPNDFDVDIVIGLPLNMKIDPTNPELSDVVIQAINPGFVQLKMGPQFQNLPMRDGTEWLINKTAYKWKDDSHYLLQSKFLDWFKSVVNKALNTFENKNCLSVYTVEGVEYVIKRSQAGPAMTLIIENSETGFKLSADLVPTIKFPEDRWPISKAYQRIPENCKKDIWMVVGKPNKAAANKQDEQRSWRIALHYQERDLMHDTSNLRQVIRLVKKMRDALGMKKIASYYIKTIFFWEIIKRNDKKFWKMDPASLFKLMVRQVHCAIVARNIPYFWNKSNNLIGHVEDNILKNCEIKLSQLLEILEQPTSFRLVAKYLLSPQEYKEYSERHPVPAKAVQLTPEVKLMSDACNFTNLNSLLSDIYVKYIKLDEEAFTRYYKVFDAIFLPLNKKMKEVDPYYNKYQSMVKFAGSHYDNLLLQKPNDFDVDIVIGLPLNMKIDPTNPELSDVGIQAINPGFVQLKMGPQFQNLPMRDGTEWLINKTAYKWKDDSHYLLQSKFLDWFKSVVNKALNTFENKNCLSVYTVEGVEYVIKRSQAGPAMTLIIENSETGFKLSADLVPTIKFPEDRWPISKAYQRIPENCKKDIWMVVGKPNKAAANKQDEQRSWRIALHYQERDLMHDTSNLRQVIRLIKKMRDALGMTKIASYYIKTIFYWEIVKRNDKKFWATDPATLFKLMVRQVHRAIVDKNIPYFWNKSNNLIGHVDDNVLKNYESKLAPLLEILEQPTNFRLVAKFLLSPQEFKEYNKRYLHL